MRKASMVLGIVGGVLAIMFAAFTMFCGAVVNTIDNNVEQIVAFEDGDWVFEGDEVTIKLDDMFGRIVVNTIGDNVEQIVAFEDGDWTFEGDEVTIELEDMSGEMVGFTTSTAFGIASSYLWIAGILSIIGAAFGIVGGGIVLKKNVLAGVFMLVAAVPSFFTGIGFIASIIFIVGGVLALLPVKKGELATPTV